MASYDLKAILGEKLKRLVSKTLKALVDCMCTVGASLCSLDKRVSALESVEIPEGGYKPMQEPVASPSASGTAIQFIESVSQDATGRMTATKKTVRTGSTSQTGVLQLTDSHTSTSTTTAATPKNVKEAYDLANSKQSPATTIAGYGITDAYTKTEVDTFLAAKAEQVNVTLGNSKALAITMPYTLRTGRSTALVLVSGNNGKCSLMEIGWFKDANAAVPSTKLFSHVIASSDTAQDCVPKVYVTYGASGVDSVIYLVLSNSSSGSEWATQMSVMLNCENMGSVSIGAVDSSTATAATDVSSGTTYGKIEVEIEYNVTTFAQVKSIVDAGLIPYFEKDGVVYRYSNYVEGGTPPTQDYKFVGVNTVSSESVLYLATLHRLNYGTYDETWSISDSHYYPGVHTNYTAADTRKDSRTICEALMLSGSGSTFTNVKVSDRDGELVSYQTIGGDIGDLVKLLATYTDRFYLLVDHDGTCELNDLLSLGACRNFRLVITNVGSTLKTIKFYKSVSGSTYSAIRFFGNLNESQNRNYFNVDVPSYRTVTIDVSISSQDTQTAYGYPIVAITKSVTDADISSP